MNPRPDVLICRCRHARVLNEDLLAAAADELRAAGRSVAETPDLCELAANRDPMLAELATAPAPVIIACRPRAVRWLFNRADAPLPQSAEIRSVRADGAGAAARTSAHDAAEADDAPWTPWFPVLDYDRCTGCRQCLSFCLFGVYALSDDGRVEVRNPRNCKNNCPACARICPTTAIIFPKLNESPIDGAELDPAGDGEANVRVDLDGLLGEDAHAALLQRGRRRRGRLLKRSPAEQAEEERTACGCSGGEGEKTPEASDAPAPCACACDCSTTSGDAEPVTDREDAPGGCGCGCSGPGKAGGCG